MNHGMIQGAFQPRGRRGFTRTAIFAHGMVKCFGCSGGSSKEQKYNPLGGQVPSNPSTCSMNKYRGHMYYLYSRMYIFVFLRLMVAVHSRIANIKFCLNSSSKHSTRAQDPWRQTPVVFLLLEVSIEGRYQKMDVSFMENPMNMDEWMIWGPPMALETPMLFPVEYLQIANRSPIFIF